MGASVLVFFEDSSFSCFPQIWFNVCAGPALAQCREENGPQGHGARPPKLRVRWGVPSAWKAFVLVSAQGRHLGGCGSQRCGFCLERLAWFGSPKQEGGEGEDVRRSWVGMGRGARKAGRPFCGVILLPGEIPAPPPPSLPL